MSKTKAQTNGIQKIDIRSIYSKIIENIFPAVISFALCFLSSQARVFGQFSPFGVAFAASFGGSGILGGIPIVGILFGYFLGGIANLKYIIAVIIVAVLKNTFLKSFKKVNTENISAVIATISLLAASVFFLIPYGFLLYDVILMIAEALICMSFAYFFGIAQPIIKDKALRAGGLSQKELAGVVLSLSVFLLALSVYKIYDISLAHVLAVFVVLITAYYGGMANGSMAGVLTGITMSLGSPMFSYIIGAYSFGGLLAGIFANTGRLGATFAFIAANSIITIYFNGSTETLIGLYEILLAGIIFVILPKKTIKNLAGFMLLRNDYNKGNQSDKLRKLFVSKLSNTAKTFKDISKTLETHMDIQVNKDIKDTESLNNKVIEKVCKNCRLSMYCWGNSYNDTAGIFNDLKNIFKSKGKIETDDLPGYFNERCIKKEKLINELNINYINLVSKVSSNKAAISNRKVLAVQYGGIANIIENIADEFSNNILFDSKAEDRIKSYLASLGAKQIKVSCFMGNDNIMTIEGGGSGIINCPDSIHLKEKLSNFTGRKLELADFIYDNNKLSFKLTEKEYYSVTSVKVFRNKKGEKCCGDTSSIYRTAGGKYVINISDGMGSGKTAAINSSLTVKLLEKLLKAGFDKESACKLVNSSMILKSNDETFVTVDLAIINLISGIAEFVKAGAAPSYIKRGKNVFELSSSSLPAGILTDAEPEKVSYQLREGDMLIMVSDGISVLGTQFISQKCAGFLGDNPAELAASLLAEAELKSEGKKDDDMTVAVVLLKSAS